MSTAKKIRIGLATTALATMIAVPTYFIFKKPPKLKGKTLNAGVDFLDNLAFCTFENLA